MNINTKYAFCYRKITPYVLRIIFWYVIFFLIPNDHSKMQFFLYCLFYFMSSLHHTAVSSSPFAHHNYSSGKQHILSICKNALFLMFELYLKCHFAYCDFKTLHFMHGSISTIPPVSFLHLSQVFNRSCSEPFSQWKNLVSQLPKRKKYFCEFLMCGIVYNAQLKFKSYVP